MFTKARDYYESPNSNGVFTEDNVLIGLISLALSILKHQQNNVAAQTNMFLGEPCLVFLNELFDYLFKITNNIETQTDHQTLQLPKCRAVQTRALCFDLLLELCKCNVENYKCMNQKLIDLHKTLTITIAPFAATTG